MKKIHFVAAAVLTSVFHVSFALADSSTQMTLDRAIAICDHEVGDANSGAYDYYQLVTVESILTELKELSSKAISSNTNESVRAELRVFDQRLDDEYADASSGRWSNYQCSTVSTLMQELKSDLLMAKRLDGSSVDPVLDNIDRAIGICDHEIDDATSGAYPEGYKLFTIESILKDIKSLADNAENRTADDSVRAQLRLVDQRINDELTDAESGKWSNYRSSTVATLLQEIRSNLVLAKNLSRTHSISLSQE